MKRFTSPLLLGLAALLYLSGCTSVEGPTFRKRTDKVESFKLITLGDPDQHFTAKLNLDGQPREISGGSPAEFPLDACVLTGTIRKTHGDGTLRFRIVTKESTLTFGQLTEPNQSFRFRYHDRGIEIWN